MLIRFRVANYRSVRDEYELSLIATEFDEARAARPVSSTEDVMYHCTPF